MSGLGKCFFEIPIYRCDQNQHTKETEEERKNYIASRFQFPPELPHEIHKQISTNAETDFNVKRWYPWRYNEIVGWLRLCADGTRIVGELWHIKAKRIRRRLRKKGVFCASMKFLELSIDSTDSSEQIFNKIRTELEQLNTKRLLKKRYIDTDIFKTTGPFIDWRQLLGLDND
jgi:hypothetical protein